MSRFDGRIGAKLTSQILQIDLQQLEADMRAATGQTRNPELLLCCIERLDWARVTDSDLTTNFAYVELRGEPYMRWMPEKAYTEMINDIRANNVKRPS